MRIARYLPLIVFLLLIAGASVMVVHDGSRDVLPSISPANGDDNPPPPIGARPGPLARNIRVRGISLQLNTGDPNIPWERFIDEIAATGANTVNFTVSGYQENGASTSIFIDSRKVPTDRRVTALIDYAHSKGLKVMLMPIVLLENPRGGEWRGRINPGSWEDWWEDYTNFVMHYMWLASGAKAEIFIVGSELISTERQTQRWKTLISRVRKHYGGMLCYSANWDHYTVPKFWDDLDILGMTTYYDLTGGKDPTVERLMQSWIPLRKDIMAWQRTVNLPILFTEVGWPNQETCAQYPWDYYRAPNKPAPQFQANCFEAFFRTWHDQPNVMGVLVWEWRNRADLDTRPDKDTSYVPCDKPAMDVVRHYFAKPPTTAPAH